MNKPDILMQRLREKMNTIINERTQLNEQTTDYQSKLFQLIEKHNYEELCQQLLGYEHTGARPTEEYKQGIIHDIPATPTTKENAVKFSEAVLSRRPFCFVDGSEIKADPTQILPIAAVNIHGIDYTPGQGLTHTDDAEVITHEEFNKYLNGEIYNLDYVVGYRRWHMEIQYLIKTMQKHKGTGLIAVYDGSIINSFALQFRDTLKQCYMHDIKQLLKTAKETQTTLIGYTDNSRAKDLTAMLKCLNPDLETAPGLTDPDLVKPALPDFGGRTCIWQCDRGDGVMNEYTPHTINFVYATLAPGRPCRIEFPAWTTTEQVNEACQFLLAQGLSYHGYPRSIDDCHQSCTISYAERDAFQQAYEVLCERAGLISDYDRKTLNKRKSKVL